MRADVLILMLAFLCGVLVYSEACSCFPMHPQEHYCGADFVILARVRREWVYNDTRVYKVRVRKPYKFNEKTEVALKSGRILTPAYDSMCGFNLELGKLYVLSGSIYSLQARMVMCDMMMEWNKLTRRQRKGLKLLYKHGCTCDIKRCRHTRCNRQKDRCNWSSDCETLEGICMRQANGSCMWNKNKALATCKGLGSRNRYYYTNTGSSNRNATQIQNTALLYHLP